MTAQNDLENHGTLEAYPFAELLVEIVQANLSGALRINSGSQKSIVYFRDGQIVYAVSNSKSLRLFNILLRKKRIDAKLIRTYPNFANDVEFSASLVNDGILPKEDIDEAFVVQMTDIVVDLLTRSDGEWTFNPLVRARDGLQYQIDARQILIDYARCSTSEHIYGRFKSVQESFAAVPEARAYVGLQAHEAEILRRFENRTLTIEELRNLCTMPEGGILQALYTLWLGGLLVRRDWNAAFSPSKIGAILAARMSKVKNASDVASIPTEQAEEIQEVTDAPPSEAEPVKLPEIKLTLPQYLEQIEKAETHYDALGIQTEADAIEIKHAYFSLAKMFHPDRYHRESEGNLRRIQMAFTVLAQAHEILKSPESREAYNSKMYREIEAREKRRAAGQPDLTDPAARQSEQGLESFEEGLNMLNDEEFEAAAAYLGRAVHYSPQNALYHAYYGVALSKVDEKQRHKAESELQTAIKLDPKNSKVRMMLVDFLIDQNMLKRAEGELKRFLELVPNSKEALAALAKLKQ